MKTGSILSRSTYAVLVLSALLASSGCDDGSFPAKSGSASSETTSDDAERSQIDATLERAKTERAKLETQLFEKERRFAERNRQFRETLKSFDEKERRELKTEFQSGRLSKKNRERAEIVRLFGDWKKLLAAEKERKEARNLYDRLNAAIASGEETRQDVAVDASATVELVEGLEALVDFSQENELTPDDLQLDENAEALEDVFDSSDESPDDVERETPTETDGDAKNGDATLVAELNAATAKLSQSDSAWFEIVVLLENADKIESIAKSRTKNAQLDQTLNDLEKRLERLAANDPNGTKTIRQRFLTLTAPEKIAKEIAEDDARRQIEHKKSSLTRAVKAFFAFAFVVFAGLGVFVGTLLSSSRRTSRFAPNPTSTSPPNPTANAAFQTANVDRSTTIQTKIGGGIVAFVVGSAVGGPLLGLALAVCVGTGFAWRDAIAFGSGCLGLALFAAAFLVATLSAGAFFYFHVS